MRYPPPRPDLDAEKLGFSLNPNAPDSAPTAPPEPTRRWLLKAGPLAPALGWAAWEYIRWKLRERAAESAPAKTPLGLRIEPVEGTRGRPVPDGSAQGQFLVKWDREAGAVREARSAVLRVMDGAHTEDVELSLQQLRSGSVIYNPIATRFSVILTVTDAQGRRSSETASSPPEQK